MPRLSPAEQARFNRTVAKAPSVKRGRRLSFEDFRLAEHELEQIDRRLHPRRRGPHLGFDVGAGVRGDKLIARALAEQLKSLSPSEIKKHPARAGLTAASIVAPEFAAARAGTLAELLGEGVSAARAARAARAAASVGASRSVRARDLALKALGYTIPKVHRGDPYAPLKGAAAVAPWIGMYFGGDWVQKKLSHKSSHKSGPQAELITPAQAREYRKRHGIPVDSSIYYRTP